MTTPLSSLQVLSYLSGVGFYGIILPTVFLLGGNSDLSAQMAVCLKLQFLPSHWTAEKKIHRNHRERLEKDTRII